MGKTISIGLLGSGVVGSGIINIIHNHQDKISHQLGVEVKVGRILVRDINKKRDLPVDASLFTTDPNDVLNDPEISVIMEVMGGIDETKELLLKAFANKKHVVTANKDLVALHGPELEQTAKDNACDFYYEASVAGGIPILNGINQGLSSDHIQKVMGIVNGTTNYILTKMEEDGSSYENALQQAKDLGFAEADPTGDVAGLDAARKMAILGRLSFSTNVDLVDVETNGIQNVALEDLQHGEELGYSMKLIGNANFYDHKLEVSVQPTFIPKTHPLAAVKNEYNAVYVYGEAIGETMFYGPGAGSLPTATAMTADMVTTIKNQLLNVSGKRFVKAYYEKQMKAPEEQSVQHYVRLHAKDESGVFSTISGLLYDLGISFKRILQTPVIKHEIAEIIFVTHHTSLANFERALRQLEDLDEVIEVQSYYRVEGDAEEWNG